MANGFDVAMGLVADTFKEDEELRRLNRAEEFTKRQEERAEDRKIAAETRADLSYYGRQKDARRYAETVRDEARDYSSKLQETQKLLALKETAAKYGLNYKGLNKDQLIKSVNDYEVNMPALEWFAANKDDIDRLLTDNPEVAAQFNLEYGPINLERLQQEMNPNDLKALQAKLASPVTSVKQSRQNALLKKQPAFQNMLNQLQSIAAPISQNLNKLMVPYLGAVQSNVPGAKPAHLAVAGVLANNEEWKKLLTEEQRATFQINPNAFLEETGRGYKSMTPTDAARIGVLFEQAKQDALGELKGGNSLSLGKVDQAAAMEFLEKDMAYQDFGKLRSEYVKLVPHQLKLMDILFEHETYGPLLREEFDMMSQAFVDQADAMDKPPAANVPALGAGARTTGTGTPATTPQPAAPLPKPNEKVSVKYTTPEVRGESGVLMKKPEGGGQSPLELAEKYLDETWFTGRMLRGPFLGNSPADRVEQAIRYLEEKREGVQRGINTMGAIRNADGTIDLSETYTRQSEGTGAGDEVSSMPFGPVTYKRTGEELERNKIEAPNLFRELDQIGADLKTLKAAAEKATGAKIPGLGTSPKP